MKKFIICILSVFIGFPLFAQFNIGQSSNQDLIKSAVKDGILLVRQEYSLQDVENKQLFGQNNKKFFGISYSIALKLNGDYVGEQNMVSPWTKDPNYSEFSGNAKYIPLISQTQYRTIENPAYETLAFDTARITSAVPGYIYTWPDSKGDFGFQVDNTAGLKKGWIVWVTAVDDIQAQDSTEVDLEIYRTEITIVQDSIFYEIKNPNTTRNIIGGFYVLPVTSRIGQITFNLVGMLHLIDDKWNIVTFGAKKATGNKNNKLTPVTEEI
jgi:hypothetical protein